MAQKDGNAKTEKYIYGVVRKSAHAGVKGKGVWKSPVQIIAEDDVAVVASDIEASDELEAGRDELMAHSQVLERAIEGGTILPMRFGIVMPNESSVRDDLLAPYREELESQLAEFDGKVEINLKGMYDEDAILREIVSENRQIAKLQESIRGVEEDASYPQRAQLGELVANALIATQETDGPAIIERLQSLADDVVIGEPSHELMAVNASFLVDRKKLDKFDRAVDELGSEQAGRINFKYTGPLAPHSFVSLSVPEEAAVKE